MLLVTVASVLGGWALLQSTTQPVIPTASRGMPARPNVVTDTIRELPRVPRFDDAAFRRAVSLNANPRSLVVTVDRAVDRPHLDIVVADVASRAEHGRLPAAVGTTTWSFPGLATSVAYDVFLAPHDQAASRTWLLRTHVGPTPAAHDASTSNRPVTTRCKLSGQLGELQFDFAAQGAPAAAVLLRLDAPNWRRTARANEMPDGTARIQFEDLGDGDYLVELLRPSNEGQQTLSDGRNTASEATYAATRFPITVRGTTLGQVPP